MVVLNLASSGKFRSDFPETQNLLMPSLLFFQFISFFSFHTTGYCGVRKKQGTYEKYPDNNY